MEVLTSAKYRRAQQNAVCRNHLGDARVDGVILLCARHVSSLGALVTSDTPGKLPSAELDELRLRAPCLELGEHAAQQRRGIAILTRACVERHDLHALCSLSPAVSRHAVIIITARVLEQIGLVRRRR